MPMPSKIQAATNTAIEVLTPSSANPAASVRLDAVSTGLPPK